MFKRPLIFATHADDEIGMAPIIWKMSQSGADVHLVIMTDGSEGYPRPEMKDEIVALRKQESAECDKVLGIGERIFLDEPDMGLKHTKETVLRCMKDIRRVRPDVVFTQGPHDSHPDHRATNAITLDALWQAGNPVCAGLGEPWKTPVIYYFKGVNERLPRVTVDVTDCAYKRQEALATQVSQHVLFNTTKDEYLARAAEMKENPKKTRETFWLAGMNHFDQFVEFPPEE